MLGAQREAQGREIEMACVGGADQGRAGQLIEMLGTMNRRALEEDGEYGSNEPGGDFARSACGARELPSGRPAHSGTPARRAIQ